MCSRGKNMPRKGSVISPFAPYKGHFVNTPNNMLNYKKHWISMSHNCSFPSMWGDSMRSKDELGKIIPQNSAVQFSWGHNTWLFWLNPGVDWASLGRWWHTPLSGVHALALFLFLLNWAFDSKWVRCSLSDAWSADTSCCQTHVKPCALKGRWA